jgi:dCTP diphosphatase
MELDIQTVKSFCMAHSVSKGLLFEKRDRYNMNLQALTLTIRKFTQERDWDQFHNPKDLAVALGIEVSELQEITLWTPTGQSAKKIEEKREAVEHEVGDILIYLLRFCDVTGIDPIEAASNKLRLNAEKYPVHKSKGNSKKYTEL